MHYRVQIVKRGQKLTVKKFGRTLLVLFTHSVVTFCTAMRPGNKGRTTPCAVVLYTPGGGGGGGLGLDPRNFRPFVISNICEWYWLPH